MNVSIASTLTQALPATEVAAIGGAPTNATSVSSVSLNLFKNAMSTITDEMALTVVRTAHSNSVREMMDFSCALCDADGAVVAQGLGLALHLGTMPDVVRTVHARGPYKPGDVLALNDPYRGGTHLPDIYVIRPMFCDGTHLGYAVVNMHHVDVGGRVPGSVAPDSTEVFQEGIRFGPEYLEREGVRNETLFNILASNTRLPVKVMGDLQSQCSACLIGERAMIKLVRTHGLEYAREHTTALMDYAEKMARAEIAGFPDGRYSFTDYLDDDGIGGDSIPITANITVSGDGLAVDFDGSSPQVRGAINCVMTMTRSAVYCTVRSIMRSDIPDNEGFCRSITAIAPESSIVNPTFPAAVGARGVTAHRICDTMLGALAKLAPDRVMAADEGGSTNVVIGGRDATGAPFVLVEFVYGAWGGRPTKDGIDGISNLFANLANNPVEVIESEFPVRIRSYGFVPDTGGPGRFRGGLSVRREYELLAPGAALTLRSDRRKHPPHGVNGGSPGSPSSNVLNPDAEATMLPTKFTRQIHEGSLFQTTLAGGGGYGAPVDRDLQDVFEDLRDGKVTPAHAREAYGVVLQANGALDAGATATARAEIRKLAKSDA